LRSCRLGTTGKFERSNLDKWVKSSPRVTCCPPKLCPGYPKTTIYQVQANHKRAPPRSSSVPSSERRSDRFRSIVLADWSPRFFQSHEQHGRTRPQPAAPKVRCPRHERLEMDTLPSCRRRDVRRPLSRRMLRTIQITMDKSGDLGRGEASAKTSATLSNGSTRGPSFLPTTPRTARNWDVDMPAGEDPPVIVGKTHFRLASESRNRAMLLG